MANLQFQPPPDWLIQGYANQKSPTQQTSEGVQGLLGQYITMQNQQKALESLDASRKANEFKAVADFVPEDQIPGLAKQYGINIPGAVPRTVSPAPAQGIYPTPLEDQAQQSLPGTHIIDHWNATMGQPAIGSPSGGPPMGPRPTSKHGLDKYQKNLAMTKTEGEMAPKTPITKEALLASGQPFDPMKQVIVEPPDRSSSETKAERLSAQLRNSLTQSDPYKNLNTVHATASNIAKAVKDPGAFGDLGMLFDYMKTLDPTSVVREGEQQSFRATGSFTDRMANTLNKIATGKSVTADQRKEVLKYVNARMKTADDVYRNHAAPTLRQAERLKIDPMEIDPYYGQPYTPFGIEDSTGTGGGLGANEVIRTSPDGTKHVFDATTKKYLRDAQ